MTFEETPLAGAYIVRRERSKDMRGAFERLWCAREFEARGLNGRLAQSSLSTNVRRATLRGMHFQEEPGAEEKLVACLAGSLYDVIVDIRQGSATQGRWFGLRLSAQEPLALYVPKGFAHGFITLEDNTSILYQITEFYDPVLATGFRWNDPALAITWPIAPDVVSDRDSTLPDFMFSVGGARPPSS